MKRPAFQRIGVVVTLSLLLPLNHATALEGQNGNIHLDTIKALAINRSMIARFESEFASVSHSGDRSSSDRIKRDLLNIQYKLKALDEDNEQLMKALPESLQADEFLKNMLAKAEAEHNRALPIKTPEEKNPGVRTKKRVNHETYKLHERALEFVSKKEIEKAIQLYEEIVLNDPNDDEAYLIMGHCFVIIGQFEKAERAFQNAVHISPQNLSQILPFYENLIRQNPDDANAYANLGFVCLMFGNTRRAEESFQQALSLNSQNQTALRGVQIIENQSSQSR